MVVSTHSIRYRILKGRGPLLLQQRRQVSTHSIRYRILKVDEIGGQAVLYAQVSTHSIRYRILKGNSQTARRP